MLRGARPGGGGAGGDLSVFRVEVAAVTPTVEYAANDRSAFIGVYDVVGGRPGGTPPAPLGSAPAAGEYVLYSRADGEFRVGPGDAQGRRPDRLRAEPPSRGMVTAVAGEPARHVPRRRHGSGSIWPRPITAPSRRGRDAGHADLPRPHRPQRRADPRRAGRTPAAKASPASGSITSDYADVGARPDGKVTLQVRLYVGPRRRPRRRRATRPARSRSASATARPARSPTR